MKPTLTFLLIILSLYNFAKPLNQDTRDILAELDNLIEQRQVIDKKKQDGINLLYQNLLKTKTKEEQYRIYINLYDEYKVFKCDSALKYANIALETARSLKNKDHINNSKLSLAFVLTSTGLYNEALNTLSQISPKELSNELKIKYYTCCELVYLNLAIYASKTNYDKIYNNMYRIYQDSLLNSLTPNTREYLGVLGRKLSSNGNFTQSQSIFEKYINQLNYNSRDFAMANSSLAFVYKNLGQKENEKRCYILAAINDIKCSTKENEALRKLSSILLDEDDIERAMNYIKVSKEDADFYNARLRRIEIAQEQPIINDAFQQKLDERRIILQRYLMVISLLLIISALLIILVYKQINTLKKYKKELQEVNKNLQNVNKQLSASNKTKEEYLGHFLNQCSIYIAILEKYQKSIHKKALSGHLDELLVMTKSTQQIDFELKEFYKNFDTIFISIYPNFIEEFNNLLVEEGKIIPKREEILTAELRIFALIRLGIDESSQISKFLRLSVNTVYTYRTKINKLAKFQRKDFEKEIMKIGTIGVTS